MLALVVARVRVAGGAQRALLLRLRRTRRRCAGSTPSPPGCVPNEVVVTDRCWSFLATWLLHTRTLPALYPVDIQPKAELARANEAHAILDGTPAGQALARRLGVRFLLVDPTCPDPDGHALAPPRVGAPASPASGCWC